MVIEASRGVPRTSESDFIEPFEPERVIENGYEALVMYVCWTKNAETFRNAEYFRLRDHEVEAIECCFAPSSFPSAVSTGQR